MADLTKYDLGIQEAQAEVERLRERMEAVRLEFLKPVSDFVSKWIQQKVQREVTRQPHITKSLGARLPGLKSSLEDLVKKVPAHLATLSDQGTYWPHRQELPNNLTEDPIGYNLDIFSRNLGNSASNGVNGDIRSVIGYAGQLLIEHGYADPKTRDS